MVQGNGNSDVGTNLIFNGKLKFSTELIRSRKFYSKRCLINEESPREFIGVNVGRVTVVLETKYYIV